MGRIWAGGLLTAVSVVALTQHANAQVIALDGIVVTSTKTSEAAVDSLSASSAVDRDSMNQVGAQTVTEAISGVPGVTTQLNKDDPATAINIRGLQDFGRVNVMVDGARQNFQRSGHNANGYFYLDPEFLSTVDITRGPTSTVYGSGAIGGVAAFSTLGINDILDPGEQWGVLQRSGIGTNGAGVFTSTAGGVRVTKDFDLFGQFVGRNTDKYDDGAGNLVEDSDWKDYGGSGKFSIRPVQGLEITGTALVQRFYDYRAGSGDLEDPKREGDTDADTYTLGLTYASPDNPLIDFNAKVYYTTTETRQDQLEPVTDPQRWRNFKIETTGFDVFNTSRFETGLLSHKLTYGADAFHDEVAVVDLFSSVPAFLFTPNGERTVWGSFIEDEVKVTSWLRLIGAVRYDNYELEGGDHSSDGSHVSPRGTVSVTPVQGLEVYGTWAEGYRAPAVTETLISGDHPEFFPGSGVPFTFLPNPELNPEIGQTKEIGVNVKYDGVWTAGDKLRGKFNVYRNDVEDFIDLVPIGGPTFIPGCPPIPQCQLSDFTFVQYQNISNARIEGVEAELGYDWGGGFLNVSATHIIGKDDDGAELSSIPPDWASATLAFRFFDQKLVLGSRVTVVDGKTFGSTSNPLFSTELSSDAYTLVDLFGSYHFTKWTSLDFIVTNVGDVEYNRYLDNDNSAGIQGRMALTVKLGEDGFDFAK